MLKCLPRVTVRSASTSSGVMALPEARSSSSVTGRRSAALRRDFSLFTTPPPCFRSLELAAAGSGPFTAAVVSFRELWLLMVLMFGFFPTLGFVLSLQPAS